MSPALKLIGILEETKAILGEDDQDLHQEIDGYIDWIRRGEPRDWIKLKILYAPTGVLQDLSLSNGWGERFLDLAERFDTAMAEFLATLGSGGRSGPGGGPTC